MKRARVSMLSYSGDYAEAWKLAAQGGEEIYYAQRYSVMATSELASEVNEFSTVCLHAAVAHDERLSNGVRAVGFAGEPRPWLRAIRFLAEFKPSHVLLALPDTRILSWCLLRGINVLPFLADSFRPQPTGKSLRGVLRAARRNIGNTLLGQLLNTDRVRWVTNHNVPASRDLVSIGVNPSKVVPWDWPPVVKPDDYPLKQAPQGRSARILFVGSIIESKGVGDTLRALAELRRTVDASLTIVGSGQIEDFRRLATELGVASHTHFTGRLGHAEVFRHFVETDLAVVPSRHEYAEGLPMTVYESLASRTPLICSDHPMLVAALGDRVTMFPARDHVALAERIRVLLTDAELFSKTSRDSAALWRSIQIEVRPGDLWRRWLRDSDADRQYLSGQSLTALDGTRRAAAAKPERTS